MKNFPIPGYDPNRGAQALAIVTAQLANVGLRAAAARKAGLPELWNMHRAAIFSLCEVRRTMRAAKIEVMA